MTILSISVDHRPTHKRISNCQTRSKLLQFSRYVVGWMVALREAAELAEQLIADTIAKQQIASGTLPLHADRGTSMRSKC